MDELVGLAVRLGARNSGEITICPAYFHLSTCATNFNLAFQNQTLLPLHKSLPRLVPQQRRRAEEVVEVEARQALHCYSSWHWGLVSSLQTYGTLFGILEIVLAPFSR